MLNVGWMVEHIIPGGAQFLLIPSVNRLQKMGATVGYDGSDCVHIAGRGR
jgi:hypothetical protein